jgi:hypothetical protein
MEGLAAVTTEGDEVEALCLLITSKAGWHGGTSSLYSHPSQKREGWGTRAIGLVRTVRVGHPAFNTDFLSDNLGFWQGKEANA